MMSKLTQKEQNLLASVEVGEWKSIKNLSGEKKRYSKIARYTLRKGKRKQQSA